MLVVPFVGFATHVDAVQPPETVYQEPVYPIINKLPAPPASVSGQLSVPGSSIWPIHGKITTEFGEYHEPFQSTHTGIDISSAKPAGATPVMAFREGTVVQVVHSSVSYGNHVVIDHGGGLSSLYGHLYDTTVSVGQHVLAGYIIGHEGSTGASTGPHVHFETDLNGTPVSPRRFVQGSP